MKKGEEKHIKRQLDKIREAIEELQTFSEEYQMVLMIESKDNMFESDETTNRIRIMPEDMVTVKAMPYTKND